MSKPLFFFLKTVLIIVIFFIWPVYGSLFSQSNNTSPDKDIVKFKEVDIVKNTPEENLGIVEQKLKYYKEVSNWERYFESLNDKSYLLYDMGDYRSFITHSKMVLDHASETLAENSSVKINAMLLRAMAVELTGNYDRSIELQTESARLADDPETKFYAYENNGISYEELGDFDEAIRNFAYALSLTNEISGFDPHNKGRVISKIAYNYKEKGDYDKSLKLYRQSMAILHHLPDSPYYRQTLWFVYQELADLYLSEGLLDSAMHYSYKAISIQQRSKSLIKSYLTYTGHGEIWLAKKDYKKAIESFDKALDLAIGEYKNFDVHTSFAVCLNKKAETYLRKNEYLTALEYFQKALQKIAVDFDSDNYSDNPKLDNYIIKQDGLNILAGKAEALYYLYNKEKKQEYLYSAHSTYTAACELIQGVRHDYLAEGSKHILAQKALPIYESAIEVALLLYENSGKHKYIESAYSIAESNKATMLYESIKNDFAKGFAEIPDSLLDQENNLLINRNYLQKLIKEEQQKKGIIDEVKIKKWENIVFELDAKLNKLVEEMEINYPEYLKQKKQTSPASFGTVRNNLVDSQTALIEYMLGEKNGYIFSITKNDLKIFKIKGKGQLIESIAALRPLVNLPPDSKNFENDILKFASLSSSIYENILADAVNELPDNINRLVIVPDDVLAYLPFELLLTKKPQNNIFDYLPKNLDYLFEKYAVHYQYSASLMTADKARGRKDVNINGFIGFAPTFDGGFSATRACSEEGLYSLQCNQREVESIQKIMGGEVLLAGVAGVDNFMKNAPNYRILHLATHACVDDSDSGLNKIYLSDGDLSQYELNNIKLNADLTVLSACNTGMGQLLKGEGIMSLTRSFIMAGSKSVLTSLWSVDDCATSDIMVNYYKCLKKGMPKDKAIAKAKLAYLKVADRNGSHPYYWAAFVQFGEVEALSFPGNNFYYFLLAGFGIAFFLLWYFCR
ncbi:MAG TPA: CHAT domain-containing protein [Bacteroidetes bacterium]|nr:CHAT domain-containing protein [Bacteroidota bacterium]